MFRYLPFKEDIVSSDVTVYTSFGIRFMQSAGNGWVKLNSVSDVSVDKCCKSVQAFY